MRQHKPDHRQEPDESNHHHRKEQHAHDLPSQPPKSARHATRWPRLRHIVCIENPRQGVSRMDPWRLGTSSSRRMGAPSRSFASPMPRRPALSLGDPTLRPRFR